MLAEPSPRNINRSGLEHSVCVVSRSGVVFVGYRRGWHTAGGVYIRGRDERILRGLRAPRGPLECRLLAGRALLGADDRSISQ